jgi:hypothetical protein
VPACHGSIPAPTRLPHGWVLGHQAYQPGGQGCPETATRTQFYLLADGASSARLFALWNPRSGRVLRRYDRVLAATATTIAWVAAGCDPRRCPVHLSDLAAGTDTQVGAPRGARANTGAFSPDGRYFAVVFSADVDATGAATLARVWVADTAARRVCAVPGAVMRGGDFGFGVTWSPAGAWLLLSAPADQHADQLAAWRPGGTVRHVPRRQPPTGQRMAPEGG